MFKKIFCIVLICSSWAWGQQDTKLSEISNSDKVLLSKVVLETSKKLKQYKNAKGYLKHLSEVLPQDEFKKTNETLNSKINLNEFFPSCTADKLTLRCGNDTIEFISASEMRINQIVVISLLEMQSIGLHQYMESIYSSSVTKNKLELLNDIFIKKAFAVDASDLSAVGLVGAPAAYAFAKSKYMRTPGLVFDIATRKPNISFASWLTRGTVNGVGSAIGLAGRVLRVGLIGLAASAAFEAWDAYYNTLKITCENDKYKLCLDGNSFIVGTIRSIGQKNCFIFDASKDYYKDSKLLQIIKNFGEEQSKAIIKFTSTEKCDSRIAMLLQEDLNKTDGIREAANEALNLFEPHRTSVANQPVNRYAPTEITRPARAVDQQGLRVIGQEGTVVQGSGLRVITPVESAGSLRVIQSDSEAVKVYIYDQHKRANHKKRINHRSNFTKKMIGI